MRRRSPPNHGTIPARHPRLIAGRRTISAADVVVPGRDCRKRGSSAPFGRENATHSACGRWSERRGRSIGRHRWPCHCTLVLAADEERHLPSPHLGHSRVDGTRLRAARPQDRPTTIGRIRLAVETHLYWLGLRRSSRTSGHRLDHDRAVGLARSAPWRAEAEQVRDVPDRAEIDRQSHPRTQQHRDIRFRARGVALFTADRRRP